MMEMIISMMIWNKSRHNAESFSWWRWWRRWWWRWQQVRANGRSRARKACSKEGCARPDGEQFSYDFELDCRDNHDNFDRDSDDNCHQMYVLGLCDCHRDYHADCHHLSSYILALKALMAAYSGKEIPETFALCTLTFTFCWRWHTFAKRTISFGIFRLFCRPALTGLAGKKWYIENHRGN